MTPCPRTRKTSPCGEGSYPSGHSLRGWTISLLLAQVAPERAAETFSRGWDYCWQSCHRGCSLAERRRCQPHRSQHRLLCPSGQSSVYQPDAESPSRIRGRRQASPPACPVPPPQWNTLPLVPTVLTASPPPTTPVAFSSKISRKSSRSNRTSIFSFSVVVKIDVFSFYPLPLQPRGCLSGVH